MDYSACDAIAAGFSRTIFVIRRSIADAFLSVVLERMPASVDRAMAFQELATMVDPALRRKGVTLDEAERHVEEALKRGDIVPPDDESPSR